MNPAAMLAVIPARGGSKGLPRKSIRPLLGLPLLAHSLRCAAMASVERVVVSTDDAEIASVARQHGGAVPFMRPAELARDETPMMPVLRHALQEMEALDGRRYESVLLLDPTSPARMPAEILRAAAMLRDDARADGIVACSRPTFNPFWVGVTPKDGYLTRAIDTTSVYGRRQDVPPFYRINGALYLWRRDFVAGAPDVDWLGAGRFSMLEIPEARAFSIDDEYELRLLELVVREGLVKLPWLEET